MNPLLAQVLAQISGTEAIHALVFLLIVGIAVLAIWAVGKWAIGKFGAPPLAGTAWDVIFILVGLIVLVNFLLTLIGKPFIK